jgi:hypothetical protein
MFAHHLFFLGLAVQFLVAAAGATALMWFGRAAARVVQALRSAPLPRPSAARLIPRAIVVLLPPALCGAAGVRGPPSLP